MNMPIKSFIPHAVKHGLASAKDAYDRSRTLYQKSEKGSSYVKHPLFRNFLAKYSKFGICNERLFQRLKSAEVAADRIEQAFPGAAAKVGLSQNQIYDVLKVNGPPLSVGKLISQHQQVFELSGNKEIAKIYSFYTKGKSPIEILRVGERMLDDIAKLKQDGYLEAILHVQLDLDMRFQENTPRARDICKRLGVKWDQTSQDVLRESINKAQKGGDTHPIGTVPQKFEEALRKAA